jgi:membrane fusion protein (multidrug efflux system)
MKDFMKRRWAVVAGLVIIALGIVGKNALAGLKEPPKEDPPKNTVAPVKVRLVENTAQYATVPFEGRLVSKQKIDVFSEVNGRLLAGIKPFKDGTAFKKGDVLLKLDDTDTRFNIIANRSNFESTLTSLLPDLKIDYADDFDKWENYLGKFDASKSIPDLPEVTNQKEKNFLVSRKIYNQYYAIKSQEAQLQKFTIIAPFDGIVSEANMNANTIIRAGQRLGVFLDPINYELEAGFSLADMRKVNVGDEAVLQSNELEGNWTGKISRISETVDANTQTVKAYITISGDRLYEGIYLNGSLKGITLDSAASVPRFLVVNGEQIYGVENNMLKLLDINVIHESEDVMIVKGLKDGTKLVNQVVPGAFEGLEVEIIE